MESIEPGSSAETAINQALEKITERQKYIKLADGSVYGWKTVSEYMQHNLADNEEDGNLVIESCEQRRELGEKSKEPRQNRQPSNRVKCSDV